MIHWGRFARMAAAPGVGFGSRLTAARHKSETVGTVGDIYSMYEYSIIGVVVHVMCPYSGLSECDSFASRRHVRKHLVAESEVMGGTRLDLRRGFEHVCTRSRALHGLSPPPAVVIW
jgi:hypothetical protein